MSFLMPKAPKPPAPPGRSDAEIQAEGLDERRRRGAARGRASTILTDSQGSEQAASARKVLTGE